MDAREDREALHETLASLEWENRRLRADVAQANTLLGALSKLLLIGAKEDPFSQVFRSLRDVFVFDQAAAFAEDQPGCLVCVASTLSFPFRGGWNSGVFLNRVLDGRVTATLDNRNIPEAVEAPAVLMPAGGSTLFMPLRLGDGRGLLLLSKRDGLGFNRRDIDLAKKFSLLAAHALLAFASRRQIEEREIRAAAAEEANRSKSRFIANMSHELRTPLNAIIGFSDFIASEVLGPIGNSKYAEYIRDINVSGNHLLTLVDNILLYSKMEAGQHMIEPADLPLCDALEQALHLIENSAAQCGIALEVHPVDPAVRVRADRQSLRQILLNLLGNAVKFSPRGGVVTISGICADDVYRLHIVDRGCGIAPAVMQHIGTPFLQAEDVMARQHHGSGLGLAISFGLAKNMGAAIAIDSYEYTGTTVKLDLPLVTEEPVGPPP